MTNSADTSPATSENPTDTATEIVTDSNQESDNATQAPTQVLFSDFELPESIQKALDGLGFQSPTEVQEKTLESALSGQDLMVSAQTGSGKTMAFLLPSIAHAIENLPPKNQGWHKKARPTVLVVCPTRELVEQVTQDAIKLVKFSKGMRIGCIMGGMPYGKQLAGLKGARVVVATPGRLLDLAQRGQIQLNDVTHLILDEADRMLDLGFQEDLAKISELCQNRTQTLLFSATFADNIVGLAKNLMDNPERITLARTQDKHGDITQSLYYADNNDHKKELLNHWLNTEEINQAVIFVPTQVECDSLTEKLREEGQNVISLHGGMRQFMRMKRLKLVRSGKVKILVATDVAARGLDVPNISHVINYGLPMRHEDYVHRIGRTGRAGRKGNAITVATHRERGKVRALQQTIAQDIEVLEVAGLEPSPPPPRKNRKGSKDNNKGRNRKRNDGGYKGGNYKGRSNKRNDSGYKQDKSSDKHKDVDGNSKSYRSRSESGSDRSHGYKKHGSKSYGNDQNRNDRNEGNRNSKRSNHNNDRNERSFNKGGKRRSHTEDTFNQFSKSQGDFFKKSGANGRKEGSGNKKPFKKYTAKKPFKKDGQQDNNQSKKPTRKSEED